MSASPASPVAGLVDWHNHLFAPGLVPPAQARGRWPGVRTGTDGGLELTLGGEFYRTIDERTVSAPARLPDMDAQGVAVQVLSPPPYAVAFAGPADEYASLVRQHNDELLRIVAERPDRFAMLGMLPYGDDAAVFAELDHLAGRSGVAGVCLTAYRDDALCVPQRAAMWRAIADAGHLVFVHPADTAMCADDLGAGSMFGLGMPFSTGRLAVRMITSGLLAEVPALRVLLAHAGGALPAIIDRVAHGWTMGQLPQLAESPRDYARRAFWADSAAYGAVPLRAAQDALGVDRLVYGSDYPFIAAVSPQQVEALEPAAGRLAALIRNGEVLLRS